MIISKEDYQEQCCPLKKPTTIEKINIRRVIEKLDEYLNRQDFDGAERHLIYWLAEAQHGNDKHGELSVLNEQIGLYRKTDQAENSIKAADAAIALAEELGLEGTITMGTTLINAGTAYKAFGKTKEAIPFYDKATTLYESILKPNDSRLGGLYNNMALALMELGDYDRAKALFEKAISVMQQVDSGELECAISYCNLADLADLKLGHEDAEKEVNAYLDKAIELLDSTNLDRNGYYAYVAEKCASAFAYYGYFLYEKELLKRANEIHERT